MERTLLTLWFWMEPFRCQTHEPVGTSSGGITLCSCIAYYLNTVLIHFAVENNSECCDVLAYMFCKVKGQWNKCKLNAHFAYSLMRMRFVILVKAR